MRRRLFVAAGAALSALAVTACSEATSKTSPSSSGSFTTDQSDGSQDLSKAPTVEVPNTDPPSKLETKDLVVGDGTTAKAGDRVGVQYVGVAWSTGKQFDSSWERGELFTFGLGAGEVIEGWDQGVEGMKVGGRRQLIIPPDLGYGDQGAGEDIKADETLIFVVDLVTVKDTPQLPDDRKEPTIQVPNTEPPTELKVEDEIEGSGDALKSGDQGLFHYAGVAWSTGEQFDSSWLRGEPISVQVGTGEVIKGWDEGLLGMKPGGRRKLTIPPDLAYGEEGAGGVIGPDETLIFVVDFVGLS